MEILLEDGNYRACPEGGLEWVDGHMETVQRIMMKLAARKGGFYPLPDYGSRLHLLRSMKPGDRHAAARQFVHEALAEEKLTIGRLECSDLADGGLLLRLWLDISGRESQLSLSI